MKLHLAKHTPTDISRDRFVILGWEYRDYGDRETLAFVVFNIEIGVVIV